MTPIIAWRLLRDYLPLRERRMPTSNRIREGSSNSVVNDQADVVDHYQPDE